jgi:hypothetical protein
MISVLCPSRGNPGLLARSVESLRSTADQVEILIAADDDDPGTVSTAQQVADQAVVFPRFGYDGLHRYYQELALLAQGGWLLVWNDDFTMLTKGWDTVIEALPAGVLVADLHSPHSPLCVAPAVRRRAMDAIGTFSSDNPHVDTFWQDTAIALGVFASVPVYINLETPVKPGNSHGFYDPPHQGQMAAYRERIASCLPIES